MIGACSLLSFDSIRFSNCEKATSVAYADPQRTISDVKLEANQQNKLEADPLQTRHKFSI